jgi:hypothetical protein
MIIEFPKKLNYALYFLHNHRSDGQIVHVWKSGPEYAFSFHDEAVHRPAGRDWVCVGELVWRVESGHFVHKLLPLHWRSERELKALAHRKEAHKQHRLQLWGIYEIETRLTLTSERRKRTVSAKTTR